MVSQGYCSTAQRMTPGWRGWFIPVGIGMQHVCVGTWMIHESCLCIWHVICTAINVHCDKIEVSKVS